MKISKPVSLIHNLFAEQLQIRLEYIGFGLELVMILSCSLPWFSRHDICHYVYPPTRSLQDPLKNVIKSPT
ncbi:MAG: hypothetical protein JKY70_14085 [Mucilaginibacter sp.]|nr:hypothetical protein [Mucilaginibacter sp.]